jgi:hypothetical protein
MLWKIQQATPCGRPELARSTPINEPIRNTLLVKAQNKSGSENTGPNEDRDVDADLQSGACEKSCKMGLAVQTIRKIYKREKTNHGLHLLRHSDPV